jgi:hypothetical protein
MTIIILEHPRISSARHFNDIANTPLWSCLLGGYGAAALEQAGHQVEYLDAVGEGLDFAGTAEQILARPPELLGINGVYFWEHTSRLFDFLADLRQGGFTGHISLFGFFPTLAYEPILSKTDKVDSIVMGECEVTLVELAERLQAKKSYADIAGLACRTEGGVSFAASRKPAPDPDRFAFPLRKLIPGRTASILASRGCYNQCGFCPIPSFYNNGPLWRGRTVRNVVSEIEELLAKGVTDFYFVDPNFIGPGKKGRERIFELAEAIRPLGITFGMETRAGDLDEEILTYLSDSGLTSLLLGVESGSAAILAGLNKKSGVEVNSRAIAACRAVGIEPEIGFLMFVPDSSLLDLEENYRFLEQNRLLDRLDRTANLLSHHHIVLMGTSGYQGFVDQGRLVPEGILGFEGMVDFRDPRVRWVYEQVSTACLYVLKEMAGRTSPIHWRGSYDGGVYKEINDYLAGLFRRLLQEAQNQDGLPESVVGQKIIIDSINRYLSSNPRPNFLPSSSPVSMT